MGTDICKELLQKLQRESGSGVGPKAGIGIVKVGMRDLARVSMSAVGTLDFGSRSDMVEKLHGAGILDGAL